jgi:hypothetical protein
MQSLISISHPVHKGALMRHLRRAAALLLLLGSLLLTGCATEDPEYNAFYRRGWLWPRSMDSEQGQIEGSGVRSPVRDRTLF